MDERIYDEFGRRRPTSNDASQRRNSRSGDFKVNINFDDDEQSTKYYSSPSQSGRESSSNSKGNFRVSIPEQNNRPYQQQRRPSSSARGGSTPNRAPAVRSGAPSRPSSQNAKKTGSSSAQSAAKKSPAQSAQRSSSPQKRSSSTSSRSRQRKKYDRKKSMIIFISCLIGIVLVTTVLSSIALATINDILAINKSESQTVSVVIPDGAKFKDVYKALCDNGLVKQKFIVKLFCKFRDYDGYEKKDKETGEKKWVDIEYVPGVYYLDPSDGIETMLESIKLSSTVSKDTVRVTFPEGWTVARIFEKIEKYKVCTAEKLYANLDIVGKQYDFYKNISDDSGRYLKAEGYLFPDTYDFYVGESASSVLKKLFSNFESKWSEEYDKQAKSIGMTKDEIIILASIIQREAKDKTQMADISSVLHNRLDEKATYPMLQMNSTKEYIDATNEYGVFTDFYYSTYLDSYNTYSIQGLPAGAICNPGVDAIKAALYPSDTNYHFFCHDKDGNVYYAVTAAEHEKNTQKIL